MSDESLDNLFKKGLSGREVNFNMESWRKMEQMLPPEPKAAGFKFGAVAAIIGALFVLSASVFVWNISDDSHVSENGIDLNESSMVTSSEQKILNEEAQVLTNNMQANKSSQESVPESKETVAKSTTQLKVKTKAPSISSKNMAASNSTVPNSRKMANISDVSYSSNTSNTSSISTTNSFNPNNTQTAFFKQSNSLTSSKGNNEYSKEEEMSVSSNAFTSISGLSELNSLSLMDEEEDNTLFASVSEGKLPTADKNKLGVIGGLNINKSLTENPSGGIAGCEFFGITYERFLNGGLSLKSNLVYSARNEVNAIKLYDKKVYGFGSKTQQTKVEAQRLAYLELPVMINYSMGNHNFMTGASLSYLISGLHEVSTEYTSPSETTYENDMQWGYTNGFKSYDVALVAGYEYNVNPKLNLGLRLNYGLLDVTDNTYFGVDSFDNNVQFRVYLTYSPFQF